MLGVLFLFVLICFQASEMAKKPCFSMFCNLHAPKSPVNRRIFKLFHMFFLRMAVVRRTFALAIGTQAPPALLDTPLGESAVGGGSPAAGLQRYLK